MEKFLYIYISTLFIQVNNIPFFIVFSTFLLISDLIIIFNTSKNEKKHKNCNSNLKKSILMIQ